MSSPDGRVFLGPNGKKTLSEGLWPPTWNVDGGRSSTNAPTHEPRSRKAKRLHHFLRLIALVGIIYYLHIFVWTPSSHDGMKNNNANTTGKGSEVFDWNAHSPSKVLSWTECYEGFQCARLTVPLLYSEPSGEEAAVALIKSPSKYPPGHEKYRGPIIFNPGGPGDSGINFILILERAYRKIFSDEFDLVGFDPRGVGFTTPPLSVFKDQLEAGRFYMQFPTHVNLWPSTLGEAYSRARVLAKLVEDRAQFVAERISTPIVARDMLSIVEAFGQEKLQYWGLSYGTVLGATFAAMFPDKVGRIVLDGVLDMEDYYNGSWANNLRDADAVLTSIYQACVTAGPSKCPIYENSTAMIQARVDSILDGLKTAPLPYYDHLSGRYEIVDYGLARNIIFTALYRPHIVGANLMRALTALERGDPAELYMMSLKRLFNALVQCNCPVPGEEPTQFGGSYEIMYAIQCGDAVDRAEDLEALRKAYKEMEQMSSFAATWPARVFCSAWNLHSKERFNGSFEQTTSHPLLLIGNVADPVTPLWNAQKVSKGFKNSVVLTQNSSGHCSISATSLCTTKAIREYFVTGTLPEKGTTCETESSIFGDKAIDFDALSEEEKKLFEASQMIYQNHFVGTLGGLGSL